MSMINTNEVDLSIGQNIVVELLKKWGWWYYKENKIDDLGYPKASSFVNERVQGLRRDSSSYVAEYGNDEALPLLINDALIRKPLYLKIAEVAYSQCRHGCSANDKADLLKKQGFYLGSSRDACRKKYHQLESNLHSMLEGYILCQEFEKIA